MITDGFSHTAIKKQAINIKIRRAMTMAKAGSNSDFKILHPDWVRDAQNDNYTNLKKMVKEDMEKRQKQAQDRRDKRSGKNQN